MTRSARTRAVVVLPVAAAVLALGGTAYAVARAEATAAQPVRVATYGAQASTSASTASQPGSLVLTYGATDTVKAAQLFFVRNTGSLALDGQRWTVAVSDRAAGNAGTTVQVQVCVGGAYTQTAQLVTTCSGTEQTLGTVGIGSTSVLTPAPALPVPVGGALSARVTPSASGSSRGFTVTVTIDVLRSQVRAATTSSS